MVSLTRWRGRTRADHPRESAPLCLYRPIAGPDSRYQVMPARKDRESEILTTNFQPERQITLQRGSVSRRTPTEKTRTAGDSTQNSGPFRKKTKVKGRTATSEGQVGPALSRGGRGFAARSMAAGRPKNRRAMSTGRHDFFAFRKKCVQVQHGRHIEPNRGHTIIAKGGTALRGVPESARQTGCSGRYRG